MILNEDFFDDQNIEPELDSTDDIAPSVLQNTEKWFEYIKSRYNNYLLIMLTTNGTFSEEYQKWKQIIDYIIKHLQYIFNAYGAEYYSESAILQDSTLYNMNRYEGCTFRDFYDYKLISKKNKWEDTIKSLPVYLPVFFNFPETKSYKRVYKFVSSIINCLWNTKTAEQLDYKDFLLGNIKVNENCHLYKTENRTVTIANLIDILYLTFPEKDRQTIKKELYADDKQLLYKLWKCFYPKFEVDMINKRY